MHVVDGGGGGVQKPFKTIKIGTKTPLTVKTPPESK